MLDLLVIASHPDDAELSCAGTILSNVAKGRKVGIADLTRGELGTRGSAELRDSEAKASAEILGLTARVNLGFEDGFFSVDDKHHTLELIKIIRRFRPEVVLCNAKDDRHPDHGRGGALASRACFLSGLIKIETQREGKSQEAWRPRLVLNYIQDRLTKPDVVVDITPYWEKKIEAIKAFKSQFYDPFSKEPVTYISTPEFFDFIQARALEFGHSIGVKYGEGYTMAKQVGVEDLFNLV
ncbi:MAG: bacillithiol biosynthesis deacetylase BshB1 [Cytophagaceae bacterium]